MNKHLIAVAATALLILAPLVHAQERPPSAEARKLTLALTNLRKNPNEPTAQQAYLQALPKTYPAFLHLFDYPGGELYDAYDDYMNVLPSLASNNGRALGQLLIQLSKDAHYEADAPGGIRLPPTPANTPKYSSSSSSSFTSRSVLT